MMHPHQKKETVKMTKGISSIQEAVKGENSYNAIQGLFEEIRDRIAMVTPMAMVNKNPERDNEGTAIADHGHKGNGPGDAFVSPADHAAIIVKQEARMKGGDDGVYKNGLLKTELRSVQAAKEFAEWLDDSALVFGYMLEISRNDKNEGIEKRVSVLDIDSITNDTSIFYFSFTIALAENILQ